MKVRTCLIIVNLVAAVTLQAQSDPVAIVGQAAKACKALKSAEYSIEATFADSKVKAMVWQATADVKDSGFLPGKYRFKGAFEERGGDLSFVDLAYDGKALRIKKGTDDVQVLDRPDPYRAGQYVPMAATMARFTLIGDWLDVMLSKESQLRLLPSKKVGSWQCDVVEQKRKVSNPVTGDTVLTVEWAFDRVTHLPVQRSSRVATVTVTKFKTNPDIEDKVFRLESQGKLITSPLGPATEHLLPIGAKAPGFSVRDPKGRLHTLASYRGKVLVLDFWATWCLPCRRSMPILQRLSDSGVSVLGVAVDMQYDAAATMRRLGHSYPIGLKGEAASKAYKVEVLPTLYVIGPDGRIRYRQAGIDRDDAKRLPQVVRAAR